MVDVLSKAYTPTFKGSFLVISTAKRSGLGSLALLPADFRFAAIRGYVHLK